MEKYNYYKAVAEAVRQYIDENIINDKDTAYEWADRDDLEEQLNDDLFNTDSVTGNASGSYTFSAWEAEENLCHNLDLLADACEEFSSSMDVLKDGAEACDVTIRCYILGECIHEVLDDMEADGVLNF